MKPQNARRAWDAIGAAMCRCKAREEEANRRGDFDRAYVEARDYECLADTEREFIKEQGLLINA